MRILVFASCFLVAFMLHAQDFKSYDQVVPGSSIKFSLAAVLSGKFQMGSKSMMADNDESPVKEIEVSSFWMGTKEVTFAEWDLYFKDTRLPQSKTIDGVTRATPQYIDLTWGMGRDATHPTNSMSHTAAVMYCKWLYSKTGFFFRLPTEAEWEYACKANAPAIAMDAKVMGEHGYFKENSDSKFHHVGEKKPNAFGLYDMLGNLSEWTIDQYDPSYLTKIETKDPLNPPASKYPKTVKGGSYLDKVTELRCSNRISSIADWNQRDPQIPKSKWWLTDGMFVGFRVVRPLKQPSKEEIEKFYTLYLK
jgi:formylglycine-generating enzyme required for sulfatase activity